VKQLLKFLLLMMSVIVASAATTAVFHLLPVEAVVATNEMSYSDFLSVTLTALGLMLTVLGFFLAALGVVGWTTFESKLRDSSFSYLTTELSKDGKLRQEFEAILTELSLQGIRASDQEGESIPSSGSSSETRYDD